MTTTYAPLFDDADLIALAGRGATPAEQGSPLGWKPGTIHHDHRWIAPAWTGYPDDIASRMIHDQQFVDLSERYDPVEPTDDELTRAADRDRLFIVLGTCAIIIAQACFVGYVLASLIW